MSILRLLISFARLPNSVRVGSTWTINAVAQNPSFRKLDRIEKTGGGIRYGIIWQITNHVNHVRISLNKL